MAVNRLNILRAFVESLETNDALFKEAVLEGLDEFLSIIRSDENYWDKLASDWDKSVGSSENSIQGYANPSPNSCADCKLCVYSVYSKYGGPFMSCKNKESNLYNKLIPISGDTSNPSCSEFSEI